MIPENKKEAVAHALQTTFGTPDFEDIRQLTDGLSTALIFRITVLGKPYLLRVITRTDTMADPSRWYPAMQTAADAGIAPHVWYSSSEDRVLITDFIETKPFTLGEAKFQLPKLFRRLHALPPFPFRIDYLDTVSNFIQKFREAKMLPEEMTNDLFPIYEQIKNIYPRNSSDMVACHNDLKPENMLFDGERPWLVDWEAAFLNDRYFDLAIAANFVVKNDGDEKDYLQAYFEEPISEYHHARFFLMRQILHFSYLTAFMLFRKTPDKAIDPNTPRPGFREFNDRVWTGGISLAGDDERVQYALVHMDQLKHNLQLKRFEDSMRIAMDTPAV